MSALFVENTENISFEDLFILDDIQRLQDDFSDATGVSSKEGHIFVVNHDEGVSFRMKFQRHRTNVLSKWDKICAKVYPSGIMAFKAGYDKINKM